MPMLVPFLFLIPLFLSKTILPPGGEKESPCSYEKGDYSLSWYYDDLSSDVVFKLSAKSPFTNFWTGVLLGEDKPTDAIGVFVRSGQLGLTDGHVSEDGILADNLTDVQSLSFDLTEDKLTAEFARPLTPQDKTDADLGRCVTLFFPVVPSEIVMGSPIQVPGRLESRRVCDLAESCVQRDSSTGLVKREEPPLCEYKHNQQLVSWHREKGHYVFSFEHPAKKGKWWSSIGAGDSMQEMSMAVAFADSGKVKNVGGYTSTDYAVPQKDASNAHQVKLISSSVKNGKAHYEFSVNEKFIEEKKNSEDGCVTLQVGVNSGPFTPGPQIKKHQVPPTAVTVCEINKCQKEKPEESKPDKPTKAPKPPKGAVVDVHPEENNLDNVMNLESGDDEQSVVPGDSVANTAAPGDAIVDGNPEIPSESVVDAQGGDPKTEDNEDGQQGPGVSDALVDVKAPAPGESLVDVMGTPGPDGQIVDAHPADNSTVPGESNENVVDFREATPNQQDQNGEFQGKREEEDTEKNIQLANGTAMADGGNPLEQLIKKIQDNAKKAEGEPAESIVDFKEDTEGSGEEHVEGSGEAAVNETNVGESQDQGGNSVLTDLEASRPPIVNVDGAVDPKVTSTTFSPPVSIPQLHSDPPSVNATSAPSQPTTSSPGSLAVVPKVCSNAQDLRICDGYFEDYLSKVQEWSTKHKRTVPESMTKACRLLSQVKHVPSMCCNRFKKECDTYSRQV